MVAYAKAAVNRLRFWINPRVRNFGACTATPELQSCRISGPANIGFKYACFTLLFNQLPANNLNSILCCNDICIVKSPPPIYAPA